MKFKLIKNNIFNLKINEITIKKIKIKLTKYSLLKNKDKYN